MDLIAFSVENVRSVRDLVVVEDLRPWEVLHGENNVGKSNLLLGLRTALALMDKVWTHRTGENFDADSMALAPGVALLGLDDLDARLAPHRDAEEDAPIRLGLRFSSAAPEIGSIAVHFTVQRQDNAWRVEGRWARQEDMDLQGRGPSPDPVPFKAPTLRFVDAARVPPKDTPSWDEWLLTHKDEDDDGGPWLAAYLRLESALAELVPSFEGGRLDRRRKEGSGKKGAERPQELIWSIDDRTLRFDDQGSGVRSLKDLLVAATAREGVCLIEEPELHLSDALQMKLRRLLQRLGAPGPKRPALQFILTSHTAMFDQQDARKVVMRDNSTIVEAPRRRASPTIDPTQMWVAEGANNAGYVSDAGIVLLPSSVRQALALPALVRFVPDGQGAFIMAPDNLDFSPEPALTTDAGEDDSGGVAS